MTVGKMVWRVDPPPFDTKILVMLGGQEWHIGSDATKYTIIKTVKMLKHGVNDDSQSKTEYEYYRDGDCDFEDCQFALDLVEGATQTEELDWTSDAILAWADYPSDVEKDLLAKEKT